MRKRSQPVLPPVPEPEKFERWTAQRKAAIILDVLKGKISVPEAARKYGFTQSEFRETVYKVSTAGKERVLYRFQGGTDGWYPSAGLTYARGMLYGTTELGGEICVGSSYYTCGTVFVVSTSGKERVLHWS
ncbi:MAG: DUF1153 domain-containing protein [Candidatus Cybelea sp.]